MKTIIEKETNLSIYYLDDSHEVVLNSEALWIGSGEHKSIISDRTSENTTIHSSVPTLTDWYGGKYLYDGTAWSLNSEYKGHSQISDAVNTFVTTIPVYTSNPFTASGTVQIGDEKITYTGVDGTNLTGCTRGAASTSAASHTKNSSVEQI
jgi:hypothetical protein